MTETIQPVDGGHHVRCMELTERYIAELTVLEKSQDASGASDDPRTLQGAVISSITQLIIMASLNAGPLGSPDLVESIGAGLGCVATCAGPHAVLGMPAALLDGFRRGVRQTEAMMRASEQ